MLAPRLRAVLCRGAPVPRRTALFLHGAPRYSSTNSYEFDAHTALRPNSTDPTMLRLRAPLSAGWSVSGSPNGGLLQAIAISAMRAHPGQPFRDPLTLTAHFLAPAVEGAGLEARAALLKRGRSSATATATLSQQGRARVHATATFGDLGAQAGPSADGPELSTCGAGAPPQATLPPPSACVRGNPLHRADLTVGERAELLVAPDSDWARGYARGECSSALAPAFEGWLRLSDGRLPCLRGLALYGDVTPPPLLNAIDGGIAAVRWLPTLEMTTHFRARPHKDEGGWVAVRARSVALRDGVFSTEAEVWDNAPEEAGGPKLCATSRQLAMVRLY